MARDNKSDRYFGVILEDIDSKFDSLIEAISVLTTSVIGIKSKLAKIEEETALIRPMYEVLKTHSRQLDNHENRITTLEAK